MNKRLFGPRSRPGMPLSGGGTGPGDETMDMAARPPAGDPIDGPAGPGTPLQPGSEAARQAARAELARCMSNPELRRMIARMRLPKEPEAAAGGDEGPAVPPPPDPPPQPQAKAPPADPPPPPEATAPPAPDAETPAATPTAPRTGGRRDGPEPFRAFTAALGGHAFRPVSPAAPAAGPDPDQAPAPPGDTVTAATAPGPQPGHTFRRVPPAAPAAHPDPDRASAPPEDTDTAATAPGPQPEAARRRSRGRRRARGREHERGRSRFSRNTRIVVGLTPVYLGLLVFTYDALFGPYQPTPEAGQPATAVARHSGSGEPATVGGYALAIDTGRRLPDVAQFTSPAGGGRSDASASAPPSAPIDTHLALAAAPPDPVALAVEEAGADPAQAGAAAMAASADLSTTAEQPAEGGVFAEQAGATAEGAAPVLAALDPAAPQALTLDPAEAEEALALDRTARREIQRRLTLAGFSAGGVDGIFGDRTRAAIAEWQQRRGVPGTGYLDAAQLAMLKDETAEDYRRYRRAHPREPQAQSRPVRARSAATGRYIDGHGCLREADGSAVPYFRAGCG